MKRTLFCFFSFLIVAIGVAQTDTDTPNSPGEDVKIATSTTNSSITKDDYLALEAQLEKRAKKVESKYFVEKEVFNSYNSTYSTTTSAVKSKIYKAGQVLLEDQKSKLSNLPAADYNGRYLVLKQIDKVYGRLIYYSREDNTRPIEKQLKKLKEPADIAPVFFGEE
ncbi:hypothetical protein [Ekhidna sp.]|uniref:hypothetical protein n=1 Tax=Ekhidna sp. TaxID=2608089 RepID=UPI0032995B93